MLFENCCFFLFSEWGINGISCDFHAQQSLESAENGAKNGKPPASSSSAGGNVSVMREGSEGKGQTGRGRYVREFRSKDGVIQHLSAMRNRDLPHALTLSFPFPAVHKEIQKRVVMIHKGSHFLIFINFLYWKQHLIQQSNITGNTSILPFSPIFLSLTHSPQREPFLTRVLIQKCFIILNCFFPPFPTAENDSITIVHQFYLI